MAQVILFNVTNGLIIGAFYVLMALGLSLILNLSNVINFAHGNFLALGGYLAFTLSPVLGYWGALVISPLLTALIGVLVERLMIRRIYNRDPVYSLLLTFGLAFVLQAMIVMPVVLAVAYATAVLLDGLLGRSIKLMRRFRHADGAPG